MINESTIPQTIDLSQSVDGSSIIYEDEILSAPNVLRIKKTSLDPTEYSATLTTRDVLYLLKEITFTPSEAENILKFLKLNFMLKCGASSKNFGILVKITNNTTSEVCWSSNTIFTSSLSSLNFSSILALTNAPTDYTQYNRKALIGSSNYNLALGIPMTDGETYKIEIYAIQGSYTSGQPVVSVKNIETYVGYTIGQKENF